MKWVKIHYLCVSALSAFSDYWWEKRRKKEDKEGMQSVWHQLVKQKQSQPSETKLRSLQPPPFFSYKPTFSPSATNRCNFQCVLQTCQSSDAFLFTYFAPLKAHKPNLKAKVISATFNYLWYTVFLKHHIYILNDWKIILNNKRNKTKGPCNKQSNFWGSVNY